MPPQTQPTTKPVIPWSVKGVDLETRDAAKDAARRAGMTLGEWLNMIIAESADESERRKARRLKQEAERMELEEQLEQLSRGGRAGSRPFPTRDEAEATRRSVRDDLAPLLESLASESRRRDDALEQKTATALGALVGFIERSEQQRRHEVGTIAQAQERTSAALRDALGLVTSRLDRLETTLSAGHEVEFAPLRQAIARLETRIADLGSREEAGLVTGDVAETLRDMEKRLVEIAGRLDRPGAPTARLAEADAERIERVEAALGLLLDRMGTAAEGELGVAAGTLGSIDATLAELKARQDRLDLPPPPDPLLLSLREDIRGLASKIDSMTARKAESAAPDPALDTLRQDVGILTGLMRELPARFDVAHVERELGAVRLALEANGTHAPLIASLGTRLDAVLRKLDTMSEAKGPDPALSPLQKAVEDIRTRMADQKPAADMAQIDRRFDEIASRLGEIPAAGAATVAPLQSSLDALTARLAEVQPEAALSRIDVRLETLTEELRSRAASETEGLGELGTRLDTKLDGLAEELRSSRAAEAEGIGTIGSRLDQVLAAVQGAPEPDFSPVYAELAALRETMTQASQPDADSGTLDALQQQIASLAGRMETADEGFRAVRSLEQSIGDLFARIEEARRSTIEAAQESARTAVREATLQLASTAKEPPAAGEAIDRHTRDTLDAVQDTLEKIVERLAMLESDIAGDRVKLIEVAERAFHRADGPGPAAASAPAGEPAALPPSAAEKIAAAVAAAETARAMAAQSAPRTRLAADIAPVPPAPVADVLDLGDVVAPAPAAAIAPAVDAGAEAAPAAVEADDGGLLEPGTGRPAAAEAADEADEPPTSVDAGKSAFIAAARLAAQTSGGRVVRPVERKAKVTADSGFGQGSASRSRLRTALDERRRPILVGLAAIVFALSAFQIGRAVFDEANTSEGPSAPPSADTVTPSDAPRLPGESSSAPDTATPPSQDAAGSVPPSPAPEPAPAVPGKSSSLPSTGTGTLGAFTVQEPESVGAITPAGRSVIDALGSRVQPDLASPGLPKVLQKAAGDGNPSASYEVASRYFEGRGVPRDSKQASVWFERAAQAGFAPAQYRLGSMYEKGIGVPADIAKARTWYERGAEQGNVKAMHNLGVVLADGGGGKPDYSGAVLWFGKAASRGLRDSQYNLAILTARGLGTDQNLVQAWAWFALAAAQGDEDAGKKRDEVGARLDAAGLASAKAIVAGFQPAKPDPAANEVVAPPGGWDRQQSSDARKDKTKAARL